MKIVAIFTVESMGKLTRPAFEKKVAAGDFMEFNFYQPDGSLAKEIRMSVDEVFYDLSGAIVSYHDTELDRQFVLERSGDMSIAIDEDGVSGIKLTLREVEIEG